MRVADKMVNAQAQSGINRNRSDQLNLQTQVASMKRVTKPSDDPVSATKVLGTRVENASFDQYTKNINVAKSFLEFSDQALGEVTETMIRLKELAISQANEAGANEVSRSTTAIEVEQLLNSILQIGNRKFGDRYIFGGFQTTQAPFDTAGNYYGDHGEMKIEYGRGAYMPMNLPGSKIFLGMNTEGLRPEDPVVHPTDSWRVESDQGSQETEATPVRGPASLRTPSTRAFDQEAIRQGQAREFATESSENVFDVVEGLRIALKTNNTQAIQESLEKIDSATNQVVFARAQLGARVASLNNALQSVQQSSIEAKARASGLEDADTFQLFSDLSKNETTLKATLAASGKMVQMSLLDFLR